GAPVAVAADVGLVAVAGGAGAGAAGSGGVGDGAVGALVALGRRRDVAVVLAVDVRGVDRRGVVAALAPLDHVLDGGLVDLVGRRLELPATVLADAVGEGRGRRRDKGQRAGE